MKGRPILMSGPMVRALLDGRKTQTRRAVRNVDAEEHPFVGSFDERLGLPLIVFSDAPGDQMLSRVEAKCPYGQPGDLLWVRETWYKDFEHNHLLYRAEADDDGSVPYLVPGSPFGGGVGNARVDCWKPSIHMPRRHSRLTLELTGVRVERLQDISEADALAEGIEVTEVWHEEHPPSICYSVLWDRINGRDSWNANPWVWAMKFVVHQSNVDELLIKRAA